MSTTTTETAFSSMTTNDLHWIFSDHLQSSSVIFAEHVDVYSKTSHRIYENLFAVIGMTPLSAFVVISTKTNTVGSLAKQAQRRNQSGLANGYAQALEP